MLYEVITDGIGIRARPQGLSAAEPLQSPVLPRFPIIIGPTAGGKSELALAVAAELRARGLGAAELVSADAFQVYRGTDIGTAKPTPAEQTAIRHHLIDIVEPTEPFTVAQWLKLAEAAIEEIRGRGRNNFV